MAAEDQDDKTIWPPSPSNEYLPSPLPGRSRIAPWLQAALAGLVGGAIGAVLLRLMLVLVYLDDVAESRLWLLGGIATILIGAVFGLLIELGVYALYKRRKRRG